MRRPSLAASSAVFLLAWWLAPPPAGASPQETGAPATASPEGQTGETTTGDGAATEAPEVDPYTRAATPGPAHERLAPLVGEWQTELKVWLAPEEEPQVTSGRVETHWILGNRFIETSYSGTFLGQPFEGKGVEGYDNRAQEYVGTWRDVTTTATLIFKGQSDPAGKVRTMNADFVDPGSGTRLIHRTVTTLLDENSYRVESFLVATDGTSFKNMEMLAIRVQ